MPQCSPVFKLCMVGVAVYTRMRVTVCAHGGYYRASPKTVTTCHYVRSCTWLSLYSSQFVPELRHATIYLYNIMLLGGLWLYTRMCVTVCMHTCGEIVDSK